MRDLSLGLTNTSFPCYQPERIKSESQNHLGTYTVASDVWSLGLSLVEITKGGYPYPPETYSNVFAQLQAIVHGDPPTLPDLYSEVATDFIAHCLEKVPSRRATYAQLLQHPFLQQDVERGDKVDMASWVERAAEWKEKSAAEARGGSDAKEAVPVRPPPPQPTASAPPP